MKKILLVILLFIFKFSFSQNLVPNPSFEFYNTCPTSNSQIYYTTNWFQPRTFAGNIINSSSSDYYNSCSTVMNVPNGAGGFQYARTGNAYAGIFFYAYNGTREYLEVKLNDSMIAGNVYCVEYYVSLGFPYTQATDNYHFYFSNDSLLDSNSMYTPINVIPSVINPLGNFITDTLNWILVSGNYVANGGEKFLTIGNFYDNAHTDTIGGTNASIYCFIDDVSVIQCGTVDIHKNNKFYSPKIYPNPSRGIVNIDIENDNKYEINVFNSLGEKIISETTPINNKIDLSNQSNGIYYINIKSNNKIVNKKISLIK